MIDLWLDAVQDLILSAPGNDDEDAGELWDSTVDRLGADDQTDAESKVYYDLFEADDVAPERPFFVIVESELRWSTPGSNAFCGGAVDVFFTEQAVDPEADDEDAPVGEGLAHKRSKVYFAAWVGQLMANCADRIAESSLIKIERIELLIPPQRTPREHRDPDDPSRDYWWTCWRFHVGEG